ncbi:Serine/Threonine-protein kinase [Brazilian cedratvirus IHUMI]|uniref:Serine/Threonine-protein kinase n=1 Tax=Brazilian cedratvirus IHUMI TaxID=2126980 RepID=A0A2R8FFP9_9VIRU|nr:Serine/Threonine-protein kinase [Brazilian cedratvirus IHUMI]
MGEYLDRIGQGTYGTVFRFKKEEELFAIKIFDGDGCTKGVPSAGEMAFATLFDHPHIIKHHEIMYNPAKGSFKLLMELAEEDLDTLVRRERPSRERCYTLFLQLCSAIKYLHDANLAHFDIKPVNCLIKDGVLKLCDFGFCRFAFVRDTDVRPSFAPPETYYVMGDYSGVHPIYDQDIHYPRMADIWSLGETFFFLLTGENMFEEGRKGMLRKAKFTEDGQGYLSKYNLSQEEIDLLLLLLEVDMSKRAKIGQVMENKLFTNLRRVEFQPLTIPNLNWVNTSDRIIDELAHIGKKWELHSALVNTTKALYYSLQEKHPNRMLLLGACLYLCSKLYSGRLMHPEDVVYFMGKGYSENQLFSEEKRIFVQLKEKCVFAP